MQTKSLSRIVTRTQADRELHWEPMTSHHCRGLIREGCYRDEATGKHILTLLKQVIPAATCDAAYEALRTVSKSPSNRGGVVAGRGAMLRRITKDNALSNRRAVPKSVLAAAGNPSGDQLGFLDSRQGKELVCRETTWTAEHPEILLAGGEFFREIEAAYREAIPEEYATQLAEVAKISAALKLSEVFTTGNNQSKSADVRAQGYGRFKNRNRRNVHAR